ncbi:Acetyltransferase (GNAT) family protein [Sporomusa ovata DSM 2662]|uniref:N-Acetylneuraminate cytidylyltransferase n=1 Tax=Sporomusa ovata TaxID=2378 RepID=A0A0U1KTK2_9FIRM|nr:GNAT family N-acetyltransferase [Sporomusa ovata]EQB26359.1 acetyltransferase, GNAT family [Sporomusa ovata DSM 2662]CQR70439.1 N-Acetylneuraminate cytidylyltransferase [Sporomusa ovata]
MNKIMLKEVTREDVDLLFEWANDDTVRENSFNSNKIEYCEHKAWFYRKLQSIDCKIYIGYCNNIPIGQIRIDIEGATAVIGYSVDKHYRGKGYGTLLLNELISKIRHANRNINNVIGRVKDNNFSSQRTFEKAGFVRKIEDETIIYYKSVGE